MSVSDRFVWENDHTEVAHYHITYFSILNGGVESGRCNAQVSFFANV